jgi:DNA-binding transcriptional regulator YiaG
MSNHPNRIQTKRENPKPAEILKAREGAQLTQDQAADLVYTGWRTWYNWEAAQGDDRRRMHPATWELFTVKVKARKLLETGEITPELVKRLGLYLPPAPPEKE